MQRSLALIAVACAAGPAAAGPSPDFGRKFQAGVDAFRLGKLAEARTLLEQARALEPKLAGPHRFLAAVAQAQQRWTDCMASARTALAINPQSTELAATRRLHAACRTGAGRAPYRGELGERAAIVIESSVPGAAVKIGGLSYGATPFGPRPIAPGALAIELAKPGYLPARVSIEALPGIVTDVEVALEPVR